MIRLLLTYVVPLVLPLLGWYVWRLLAPHRPGQPAPGTGLTAAPWPWLGGIGVVLLGVTLGAFALLNGGTPGEVYEPAQLVNGKIVPGHYDVVRHKGG